MVVLATSLAARGGEAPAPADASVPTFRLPEGVRPLRYDLTLTLVPGPAKVPGTVAIDVTLDTPRAVVWLNADSVQVISAASELAQTRVTVLSGHEQFVGLAFDPPLPAGEHRLSLAFESEQSQSSVRGIFSLQDGGAWYAMTQFESISARRAFPCFDEPQYKTPWTLTLRVPQDAVALSNMPMASEAADDDGHKRVRFATTRPLPAYLVAFAVGPWEALDLGRFGPSATPMRVVVPRGHRDEAAFVARAYPQLFDRLERWFAIGYPFTKLDHVAIPLTVGFAMENAGLITYGMPNLLAPPGAATPRFRRSAANIGAHEMSHQWFGNLVTTAWWDDIWLNEAFATWIADKMVDRWRPDYDRGAARIQARAQAIDADTLASARRIREPVTSRSDIFNAFDSITYQKGATVIGMFERWIGEEPFRRGVQRYLASRRDGSATADDFLGSLAQASSLPVAPAFRTFLDQNGVPKVDVTLQCGRSGAQVALRQERLTLLGSKAVDAQRWQVPVCLRYGNGSVSRQACALLSEASRTIPLRGGCPAFVFANAGGDGYYVPVYRDDLADRLMRRRDALSAAEFSSLLYDLKALVSSGAVPAAQAMTWMRYGAAAHDRHVVVAALQLAEWARHTLVTDADAPRFEAVLREVFGPRARALGFAPRPGEGDDDQLLRRELLRVVAPFDPTLAAEARRLALAWLRDRKAIDPGMVDVVLVSAARTGDAALFDALLAEAKAATVRLDRRYLMMALLAFTAPGLAERGMAILLDPDFDVRESWTALRYVDWWNPGRPATHAFIAANLEALAKTVSRDAPGGWPGYAAGLCSEEDRAKVEAFWQPLTARFAGADRELAEATEAIDVCAQVRARVAAGEWLR